MSDVKPTKPIVIEDRYKQLELLKYHPSGMVNLALNTLEDITEGRVSILEPSNPFAYINENGALQTAFAIQEFLLLTRKTFAKLANNEDDLYRHMSGRDFLGRFSTPAKANVTFNINYNDFMTKAYVDPVTKDRVLTLPRYLRVKIENCVFTLLTSVIIKRTEGGVIDVRYDHNKTDDIFPLTTTYIPFQEIKYDRDNAYIVFKLEMHELDIETIEVGSTRSKTFKGELPFNNNRQFYFIRVFQTNDDVTWTEIPTTHSNEVWDINELTCIVDVDRIGHKVKYFIPPPYFVAGMVDTKIKFICYTTKGYINMNFSDFLIKDFKTEYNRVFPNVDFPVSSTQLTMIRNSIFIRDKVIGGRNQKTFEQLKYDVIFNNLEPHLPITDAQLDNSLRNTDFEPTKNYDVVTDREFLVKTQIPESFSRYKIARLSLDLMEMKTTFKNLVEGKNNVIQLNDNIAIIPQGTVFNIDHNSGPAILTQGEYEHLTGLAGQDLVKQVTDYSYMATFYHYVLDFSTGIADLRPYELSMPKIEWINFKDYNDTTGLGVNTNNGMITKLKDSFRVDYDTDLKVFNKTFGVNNIVPFLIYRTPNGTNYYLQGRLFMDGAGKNIFTFYIESQFYINKDNQIRVTNFTDASGSVIEIDFDIETDLQLVYLTNAVDNNFIPKADGIIAGSYLTSEYHVITHEVHRMKFGDHLKYLYSSVRTSTGLDLYERYPEDVFKVYDKTVFNNQNEIIHVPGDYVLNDEGNKIVQHVKGDIVLDSKGNPVKVGEEELSRYLNLLMLDYRAEIANSKLTNEYKEHIRIGFNTYLLENMKDFDEQLNNRSRAFLTVPNSQTDLIIRYDGKSGYIHPNQSFKFSVYVNKTINEDDTTKTQIENVIIDTLDKYLNGNKVLDKTALIQLLKERTKEFCRSVTIPKFTEVDADYIEIQNENAEIVIKKRLIITPDGYDIRDDVKFDFFVVE